MNDCCNEQLLTAKQAEAGYIYRNWRAIVVWGLRIFIGCTFLLSGLVKMIDLWGFVFKLEEYLAVWGIREPRSIILMGAMICSGYEFVFGFLIASGCYKRVSPYALMLQMLVMLPLTVYIAIENPVDDCGCFGDFYKISNIATVVKNIVITVALFALIRWNAKVRSAMFQPAIQWIVGAWISLYILIIGLIGYNIQPMIDFRSFPIGSYLQDQSDDGNDTVFIYEKNGQIAEFTIDNLPDSTWTFVDRTDKQKTQHSAFAVFDGDDEVTEDVITSDGDELLLILSEPRRANIAYTYYINEIYEWTDSANIPMIALLGTDSNGIDRWKDISMAAYNCYTVDDTQLKELVRGTMALVLIRNGRIESKLSLSAINPDDISEGKNTGNLLECLNVDLKTLFKTLTGFFGIVILMLFVFQRLIIAVKSKIKMIYQKKRLNLQSQSNKNQQQE